MLNDPRCPECGRVFDPDDPTTYNKTSRPPGPYRRLMTNVGICLLLGSLATLAVLWLVAWQDGQIVYVQRWSQTPPPFRGNHGPWRRWAFADDACGLSSILMLAALISAWIGAATEQSARSVIVVILIPVLAFVLAILHFPLVD